MCVFRKSFTGSGWAYALIQKYNFTDMFFGLLEEVRLPVEKPEPANFTMKSSGRFKQICLFYLKHGLR